MEKYSEDSQVCRPRCLFGKGFGNIHKKRLAKGDVNQGILQSMETTAASWQSPNLLRLQDPPIIANCANPF
jgi:hypothetical protein